MLADWTEETKDQQDFECEGAFHSLSIWIIFFLMKSTPWSSLRSTSSCIKLCLTLIPTVTWLQFRSNFFSYKRILHPFHSQGVIFGHTLLLIFQGGYTQLSQLEVKLQLLRDKTVALFLCAFGVQYNTCSPSMLVFKKNKQMPADLFQSHVALGQSVSEAT